jgi:antitoxin component of MazEF toxin-antitoxin module
MASAAYIKRVIRMGGSMIVVLPVGWAKCHVRPGDEVVIVDDGVELHIRPLRSKESSETSELVDRQC